MFHGVAILLSLAITIVTALQPFDDFREGPCFQPQQIEINREFIDSLRYFAAGSRYHFYMAAALMPNYKEMREDEFYYDSCFSRDGNTSVPNSIGTIYGFGRPLISYMNTLRPDVYVDGTPTNPALSSKRLLDTVLYTDHKQFAFFVQCFAGDNQRGWAVLTRTPYLDPRNERIIERIALSLGFSRENFLFMRHDSCRFGHGNPTLSLEN